MENCFAYVIIFIIIEVRVVITTKKCLHVGKYIYLQNSYLTSKLSRNMKIKVWKEREENDKGNTH